MKARPITLFAAIVLGCVASAQAQEPANRNAPPTSTPATTSASADLNVNELPLNLSRIQRRLRASAEREERDGLNLKYFVDVYAQAPPLVFFTKEDLAETTRPVPRSAPTHQEMLRFLTPRGMTPPPAGRVP
jgi:hypothetical protein